MFAAFCAAQHAFCRPILTVATRLSHITSFPIGVHCARNVTPLRKPLIKHRSDNARRSAESGHAWESVGKYCLSHYFRPASRVVAHARTNKQPNAKHWRGRSCPIPREEREGEKEREGEGGERGRGKKLGERERGEEKKERGRERGRKERGKEREKRKEERERGGRHIFHPFHFLN